MAMGMALTVEDGAGPRFTDPLRAATDFERLIDIVPERDLGYVLEAIRITSSALAGRVPVIGFAGAPWTLAAYMIEGGGSKDFGAARRWLTETPSAAHRFLERLSSM